MKRYWKRLAAAVVAALMLTSTGAVVAQEQEMLPTLRVSGAGSVSAAPDTATITLGVNTEEPTSLEAVTRNSEIMDAVIAAIRALGVDDDDIRTQNFSLRRLTRWDNVRRENVFAGYTVSNSVRVTLRDLDLVGEVLGAGATAGANALGGVQFSLSNASLLYYEALALAAKDAQNRANAIAGALGTSIAGIVSVNETGTFNAPIFNRETADMMPAPTPPPAAGEAAVHVPIEAGDLTVTARVDITFNLAR